MTPSPGPNDRITDIAGLRVGHATSLHHGTGTTVILCDALWPAAADVRGGGPGLREIEVMAPENSINGIHAIVLSGGSVFGLAAADGALVELAAAGIGLDMVPGGPRLPIVPGAILFDLNNPGDKQWGVQSPYHELGRAAARAALVAGPTFDLGSVGAGTGAMAGAVKGGIGSTSLMLEHGLIVGALVAANPVGAVHPAGNWGFDGDPFPDGGKLAARLQPGANTTLAVVACNAALSKAEAKRLAIMAHDGLARAIRPIHTPFDGDVVFAMASGAIDLDTLDAQIPRAFWLARLGAAAADALARAVVRGVKAAT